MTVRGESPAKKLVRLQCWRAAARIVPRFYHQPTLSLASAEAGDVSVLLGLGCHPAKVHAVDKDHHAAAAAGWKFPEVSVHHTDVFDYAKKTPTSFGAVFLDFCGPLRESTVRSCKRLVGEKVTQNGTVALGLLVGREQGDICIRVRSLLQTYEENSFAARTHLICEALRDAKLELTHGWCYRSDSEQRYGKTMSVFLFRRTRVTPPGVERQLRSAYLSTVAATPYEVAATALALDDAGERADLLLNISKRSVAAYKAHRTRNTYG